MINNTKIMEALNFRHACKSFDTNKKISEADFTVIMEAARMSPSSIGLEPWKFLVIQDVELRNILHQNIWGSRTESGQIPSCSHLVIALTRINPKFDSQYVANLFAKTHKFSQDIIDLKTKFCKEFQTKDFDLLSNPRHMQDWASKQTYIALGYMTLAAALLKIDTCPLEGFNMQQLNDILAEHFAIDTSIFKVSYGLAFGYRNNQQPVKTRQDMSEIFQWF